MSRWARWAIGLATLLGGAAILLPQPRPGPIASATAIVVIGLVIVACFSKFGGPVAARILGAAISFAYFCYFLIAINPYYSHKFGLSGPDHWEWRTATVAFLGFAVYGASGVYAMLTGKFPSWWRRQTETKNDDGSHRPHP
jgi:hypothetical protein